jgi:hypothetical protein
LLKQTAKRNRPAYPPQPVLDYFKATTRHIEFVRDGRLHVVTFAVPALCEYLTLESRCASTFRTHFRTKVRRPKGRCRNIDREDCGHHVIGALSLVEIIADGGVAQRAS